MPEFDFDAAFQAQDPVVTGAQQDCCRYEQRLQGLVQAIKEGNASAEWIQKEVASLVAAFPGSLVEQQRADIASLTSDLSRAVESYQVVHHQSAVVGVVAALQRWTDVQMTLAETGGSLSQAQSYSVTESIRVIGDLLAQAPSDFQTALGGQFEAVRAEVARNVSAAYPFLAVQFASPSAIPDSTKSMTSSPPTNSGAKESSDSRIEGSTERRETVVGSRVSSGTLDAQAVSLRSKEAGSEASRSQEATQVLAKSAERLSAKQGEERSREVREATLVRSVDRIVEPGAAGRGLQVEVKNGASVTNRTGAEGGANLRDVAQVQVRGGESNLRKEYSQPIGPPAQGAQASVAQAPWGQPVVQRVPTTVLQQIATNTQASRGGEISTMSPRLEPASRQRSLTTPVASPSVRGEATATSAAGVYRRADSHISAQRQSMRSVEGVVRSPAQTFVRANTAATLVPAGAVGRVGARVTSDVQVARTVRISGQSSLERHSSLRPARSDAFSVSAQGRVALRGSGGGLRVAGRDASGAASLKREGAPLKPFSKMDRREGVSRLPRGNRDALQRVLVRREAIQVKRALSLLRKVHLDGGAAKEQGLTGISRAARLAEVVQKRAMKLLHDHQSLPIGDLRKLLREQMRASTSTLSRSTKMSVRERQAYKEALLHLRALVRRMEVFFHGQKRLLRRIVREFSFEELERLYGILLKGRKRRGEGGGVEEILSIVEVLQSQPSPRAPEVRPAELQAHLGERREDGELSGVGEPTGASAADPVEGTSEVTSGELVAEGQTPEAVLTTVIVKDESSPSAAEASGSTS
jgi:hypothetical protein